jgi:hypothetical protein
MVIAATAAEAWKAFHSQDGGAGDRNPVGRLIFGSRIDVRKDVRPTRSAAAGVVPIELRGENTLVVHAAEIWNSTPALRVARTLGEAKRVAKSLARVAPL